MIAITRTLEYDPETGVVFDKENNVPVNARHPQARVAVDALARIDTINEALASLWSCDLSPAYVKDLLIESIKSKLPLDVRNALAPASTGADRVSTRSKKRVVTTRPLADKAINIPTGYQPSESAVVSRNDAKAGIEVTFATKPSAETIALIKQKGYRFSSKQALWYAPFTDDGLKWANETFQPSTPPTERVVTTHSDSPSPVPCVVTTHSTPNPMTPPPKVIDLVAAMMAMRKK